MHKNYRVFQALSAAILIFLFSIGPADARPLAIADANNRGVRLPDSPQRIVSLVPAVTEILFAMDAGDRLVGLTYQDTQAAAAAKTVVGGFFSPSMDKIAALKPDLVVVSSLHAAIVRQCADRGIATLEPDLSTLSRSLAAITTLGDLVQRRAAAAALRHGIQDQLDRIARKTAAIPRGKRLRVLRLMGEDPVMTPGDDSFQNDLIRAAGGIPPVLGRTGSVAEMSLAQWQRFNPQVIYGCGLDFRKNAAGLFNRPGWKDVDAVRSGRILTFPCDYTCRAGVHTGDFAAWLAARLYTDHFASARGRLAADKVVDRHPVNLDLDYVKDAAVVDSRIDDFTHKTLVVPFTRPMAVVSTLEGFKQGVSAIGNHYYPPPSWSMGHGQDLQALRTEVCAMLRRPSETTALLFTGEDMDRMVVGRQSFRAMTVYALVTAGAGANAQRASRDTGAFYEPGTINILVLANMRLTPRAMTRAVICATEAKTAALEDLDIRSSYTPMSNGATGTGTDNVIVVQGAGPAIDNAGGHTRMGELIAKAVYQGVWSALSDRGGFHADRGILRRLQERRISILKLLHQSDCPCGLKPAAFAAAVERQLLDQDWAAFMEAALAVSDDYERGLISDLTPFRSWAGQMAERLAGGPIEDYDEVISPADLPPVLHIALNALANGIKLRRMRRQAAD
jgi:ABC-type Fe3+-hydroxamate transport system substrate-binding protein/adenosylcobinamide amidohydrolase